MRRLLSEWKPILAINFEDSSLKKGGKKATAVLNRMRNPYAVLGMLAILPLLEATDALISFAQARNVFICGFLGALEQCRQQLYTLYRNSETAYKRDDFFSFNQLLQMNHESIPMKWDQNLNKLQEVLAFVFGDKELTALHKGQEVT